MNMNVIFFYKSNWQNEGLRLARRNKFICAMMVSMQELGIEGPNMRFPGMKQSFPVYLQNVPHVGVPGAGYGGHPDMPGGYQQQQDTHEDLPFVSPVPGQEDTTGSMPAPNSSRMRSGSVLKNNRARGETLSAMNKRVDFSLGANTFVSGDYAGDVYADRDRAKIPVEVAEASRDRERTASRRSLEEHRRQSQDLARSTSRESPSIGNLARRSTDSEGRWGARSGIPVHRNRFFGRSTRPDADEPTMMENGLMADIPENPTSGNNSTSPTPPRMDPRTGMVSPAAWRMRTNESNLHPEHVSPPGHALPARSQTEDFEMRRFR